MQRMCQSSLRELRANIDQVKSVSAASVEYCAVALKLVRDSPHGDSMFELTTCGMLAENRQRRYRIVAFHLL